MEPPLSQVLTVPEIKDQVAFVVRLLPLVPNPAVELQSLQLSAPASPPRSPSEVMLDRNTHAAHLPMTQAAPLAHRSPVHSSREEDTQIAWAAPELG